MTYATEMVHIKKSRKSHHCDWCNQSIVEGEPYDRWRWYSFGDSSTVRVHPECCNALDETMKTEGYGYEFLPGDNPRGCNCGFNDECKRCKSNEKAIK